MEETKFYNLKFLKRTVLGSLLALTVLFVFAPFLAQAQQLDTGISYGQYTGLVQTDIRIIIAKIIRVFLGVLGLVALGFTLYGGYIYLMSGGDADKAKTGKTIIKNMVIGLAIILSAFAITQFVINMLAGQYRNGGSNDPGVIGTETFCQNCGFLGSVIESHYPGRGAVAIPRNTKVLVTFKNEMLHSSLIEDSNGSGHLGDTSGVTTGDNDHPTNVFKIYPTAQGESAALTPDKIDVFLAADNRTYVFKPKVLLGSAIVDTNYTVKLTDGVRLLGGNGAFGAIGNYSWNFTVSTVVDMTPPEVVSVLPLPQVANYPKNTILQINFSEPVDPISASGIFRSGSTVAGENFQNIFVSAVGGGTNLVSGNFQITNQYRTVEFKTIEECGTNPCGQTIYCLPGDKTILTTVKSASVDSANKPQAQITSTLYDGVVDMAGNSLNGGGELKLDAGKKIILDPGIKTRTQWEAASGKILDNFSWNISTSNDRHLIAPILTSITPASLGEGVATSTPLIMSFDEPMSIGSFKEIVLRTNKPFNVAYTYAGINYDADNKKVTTIAQTPVRTSVEILHSDFWQKPTNPPAGTVDAVYYPFVPSILNDSYQNCFYPAVIQGSSECVVGAGVNKLNDTNPNCFDLQADSYNGLCTSTIDGCPFVPRPSNAQ